MSEAATIIPAIALAVSAGSAAYSGVAAADAQDKQDRANAEAKRQQDEALQMAKDQQKKQEDELAAQEADQANEENRNSARARQRALAQGAYGRQSTILTSPLGIPNQPTAPGKTILGS